MIKIDIIPTIIVTSQAKSLSHNGVPIREKNAFLWESRTFIDIKRERAAQWRQNLHGGVSRHFRADLLLYKRKSRRRAQRAPYLRRDDTVGDTMQLIIIAELARGYVRGFSNGRLTRTFPLDSRPPLFQPPPPLGSSPGPPARFSRGIIRARAAAAATDARTVFVRVISICSRYFTLSLTLFFFSKFILLLNKRTSVEVFESEAMRRNDCD